MENIDTNRKTRGGPKKPQWASVPLPGGSTPVGIGILTTAFTLAVGYPGRLALTLDIFDYKVGDTCTIYIQQSVDGINWRNIGFVNIVNGMIIDLAGPSIGLFTFGAALPTNSLPAIQLDIHVDPILDLRLQHNQTAGGGPKTMYYHYNYLMEIKT